MSRGGRRSSLDLLVEPQRIRNLLYRSVVKSDTELSVNTYFLKYKMPVHFGGMSDPFSNRVVASKSKQLLRILCEFDYPTVLSTKNVFELCKEETIAILKKFKHLIIQISISSPSEIAAWIEPSTPSPQDRIQALKMLAQEGLYTMGRIQPLIPNQIEYISSELIPSLCEVGTKHVIVEFLKLPLEQNISRTSQFIKNLGWDVERYYRDSQAIRAGREWVLLPSYKWELIQTIVDSIHTYGMTYGAGDYGLNHLGDTDCCCGLDRVEGFSGYFKSNFSYIIRKRNSTYVLWNDQILSSLPNISIREYLNSNCRVEGAYTISDYLKLKWNRPGTENAPDTFLGVTWSGEYDESGNCVYRYNQ